MRTLQYKIFRDPEQAKTEENAARTKTQEAEQEENSGRRHGGDEKGLHDCEATSRLRLAGLRFAGRGLTVTRRRGSFLGPF